MFLSPDQEQASTFGASFQGGGAMRWNATGWLVRAPLMVILVIAIVPETAFAQFRPDTARSTRTWGMQIIFSPDRKTLAVAKGELGVVELWDADSASLKRTLAGNGGPVTSLGFSRGGELVVTACREAYGSKLDANTHKGTAGVVKVWDVQTGELKLSLKAHEDVVTSVAFSSDGTLVTSGQSSFVFLSLPDDVAGSSVRLIGRSRQSYGELKFWDLEKRKEIRCLKWDRALVGSLVVSPDGKTLAVRKQEGDTEVKLVDAQTGKIKHTLKVKAEGKGRGAVDGLIFSPDGATLAIAVPEFEIPRIRRFGTRIALLASRLELWDVQQGKRRSSLNLDMARARSLAFSPDGDALLVFTGDNSLTIADPRTGALSRIKNREALPQVVAFSPDSRIMAAAQQDNIVTLADTRTGEVKQKLVGGTDEISKAADSYLVSVEGILTIAFSPDGRTMASAGNDKTIKLWDAVAATPQHRLIGHAGAILSVAISPDGATLASGSSDKEVKLWDAKSGALRKTLAGHGAQINCVAFSPDGATLASASDDETIKLWNARSGEFMSEIRGIGAPVKSVAFSPDGHTLASAGDEVVRLWDVSTSTLRRTLRGHTAPIRSVAFSPNGATLASASSDATVRLWNVETGQLKLSLAKHRGPVNSLAFTPSGKILASGSDDKTINMWDVETGKLQRSLKGHEIAVYSVSFSPTGGLLASGSGSNGLIFWDAQTGELKQIVSRLTVPQRNR